MQSIWKYPFAVGVASQAFEMPTGARVLTIQMQGTTPTIWVLVDVPTNGPEDYESRVFSIHVTGGEVDKIRGEYIGTFQVNGFVGHVFETTKVAA